MDSPNRTPAPAHVLRAKIARRSPGTVVGCAGLLAPVRVTMARSSRTEELGNGEPTCIACG